MLLTHEELFVYTIQDLRTKIKLNTPYDLVRACGLCRHLLLDESPLVHQVNKKYRLAITFNIADYSNTPLSHDHKGSGGRTIEPLVEQTKIAKISDFLKTKVLYYGSHEFTVKEMILAASHYFGGIHSGKPDLKLKHLSMLERYSNTEMKMSLWMIRSICKVILNSMEPLEIEIRKNISTDGFPP